MAPRERQVIGKLNFERNIIITIALIKIQTLGLENIRERIAFYISDILRATATFYAFELL